VAGRPGEWVGTNRLFGFVLGLNDCLSGLRVSGIHLFGVDQLRLNHLIGFRVHLNGGGAGQQDAQNQRDGLHTCNSPCKAHEHAHSERPAE
jgi:hypothetical protein